MMSIDTAGLARFWAKVDRRGPGDCWGWRAAINSHGYGVFSLGGVVQYAHRLAYQCLVGPIPDGLTIDHLCRVRSCVNPGHLEPVTHRENTLRGATLPAANARKTHCPKGHRYAGDNLYVRPRGGRTCLACWTFPHCESG